MKNSKKILIITYYWPPAGGPGVQRWLKFSKYLRDFDWQPIIYTPENPSYPLYDESLEKEVPEDLEILKTKIWEPYQIAEKLSKRNKKYKGGQFDVDKNQSLLSKISIYIRGNFFIPDARIFWVQPSIKFLKKYISENNIETIVTTGPPHSLHLIGLGLKKETPNIKWIADFRDPWTEISYYKHLKLSTRSDKKHRQLEQKIFKNANVTLATSYTDAENFEKKGANSFCITNGYDTEESNEISNLSLKTKKFTISYIGILEQLRNPENLWNAIKELCKKHDEFANELELKLVGKIDDIILNNLENSILKKNILNLGYLSHKDSVKEMKDSNLLIITNFPNESSRGIIPGKLFEYLSSGNKIISIGTKNSDVETIINKTFSGKHFEYSEQESIEDFIYSVYKESKNNKIINNSDYIKEFSRKELTKRLSHLLDEI